VSLNTPVLVGSLLNGMIRARVSICGFFNMINGSSHRAILACLFGGKILSWLGISSLLAMGKDASVPREHNFARLLEFSKLL
jgi:hypothetical protein